MVLIYVRSIKAYTQEYPHNIWPCMVRYLHSIIMRFDIVARKKKKKTEDGKIQWLKTLANSTCSIFLGCYNVYHGSYWNITIRNQSVMSFFMWDINLQRHVAIYGNIYPLVNAYIAMERSTML